MPRAVPFKYHIWCPTSYCALLCNIYSLCMGQIPGQNKDSLSTLFSLGLSVWMYRSCSATPHHRSGLTCSGSSSAPAAQRDRQMWEHLLFQTPLHFLFHRQRVATRPITPVFHDWEKWLSRSLSPGLETNACVCLPAPSFCLWGFCCSHIWALFELHTELPPPPKKKKCCYGIQLLPFNWIFLLCYVCFSSASTPWWFYPLLQWSGFQCCGGLQALPSFLWLWCTRARALTYCAPPPI